MAVTLCLSCSLDAQPDTQGLTLLDDLLHLISNFSGPQTPSGLPRAPSAGCVFPYHICPPTQLTATATGTRTPTVFCSIRRLYITFKLPRGDMDTPPRLRNFFRYLAIGMCPFRYLWNGLCDRHRAEITVMQFTGHSLPVHHSELGPSPCPILSALIRPRDLFRLLAIGMCHFLPVHYLGIAFLDRVEGQNTTFVVSLRDRWRDIYSERELLLVPYLLPEARRCQRLHPLASCVV